MIRQKFWRSEHPDDPWARLLYIAMWNWADDWGVGTCNPRELIGFVFPNDHHITADMFEVMLRDVGQTYGVVYYTVSKQPYYAIPSWPKHQKVDHPSKSLRNPGIDQAETWLRREAFNIPDDPREAFARDSRESRSQIEVERELEIELEGEGEGASRTAVSKLPARRPPLEWKMPEDWTPSPDTVSWLLEKYPGIDVAYHANACREHFLDKPTIRRAGWERTFKKWCLSEWERGQLRMMNDGSNSRRRVTKGDQKVMETLALEERFRDA